MISRALGLFTALIIASHAYAGEIISVPREFEGREIQLQGVFEKPEGARSSPVVIVLHTCGGLADEPRRALQPWINLLHDQGYATLLLDSFTARGVAAVCSSGRVVPGAERAKDALAAAYVLAARPDVRADKIAMIGLSHGGWTAVYAATAHPDLQPWRDKLATRGKIVAAIGLYPACRDSIGFEPTVPLLILIGEKDDWTPARPCVALAEKAPSVRIKVYPDTVHAFDVNRAPRSFGTHTMAYNAAAAADARQQVIGFLAQYLK